VGIWRGKQRDVRRKFPRSDGGGGAIGKSERKLSARCGLYFVVGQPLYLCIIVIIAALRPRITHRACSSIRLDGQQDVLV